MTDMTPSADPRSPDAADAVHDCRRPRRLLLAGAAHPPRPPRPAASPGRARGPAGRGHDHGPRRPGRTRRRAHGERDEPVPKGGEVHTFEPTPATLTAICARPDLIVVNGLGPRRLADQPGRRRRQRRRDRQAGRGPGRRQVIRTEGDRPNPHLWLNVAYARSYVARSRPPSRRAAPAQAAAIDATAAAYGAGWPTLDAWVEGQDRDDPRRRTASSSRSTTPSPTSPRPTGSRSSGPWSRRPGQDPTAGEIAALIDAIRASGAKAIFSEAQFSDELAGPSPTRPAPTSSRNLYNDSLGDPPVDTYEGLIRWDVEQIVAALK